MQGTSIAPEGWAVIGTVAAVFGVVAIVGTLAGHPWSILPLPDLHGLLLLVLPRPAAPDARRLARGRVARRRQGRRRVGRP
jgi:hypothetical protein